MTPFNANTDPLTRVLVTLMMKEFSTGVDAAKPVVDQIVGNTESLCGNFDPDRFAKDPTTFSPTFDETVGLAIYAGFFCLGVYAFNQVNAFHNALPKEIRETFVTADCQDIFTSTTPPELNGRYTRSCYRLNANQGDSKLVSFIVAPMKAGVFSLIITDNPPGGETITPQNFDEFGKHEVYTTAISAAEALITTHSLMRMLA